MPPPIRGKTPGRIGIENIVLGSEFPIARIPSGQPLAAGWSAMAALRERCLLSFSSLGFCLWHPVKRTNPWAKIRGEAEGWECK
jgi:hypothetical protein